VIAEADLDAAASSRQSRESLVERRIPVMPIQSETPLIMGILNLTPDSFSDGGLCDDADTAVVRALAMISQGADLIDVGGESTRPGAQRIDAGVQRSRIIPVIERLARVAPNVRISVDTTRREVAAAAIAAGATLVNDISAGRDDPGMFDLVAGFGVDLALMHMQGTPLTMQDNPYYVNVVEEVLGFLLERAAAAERAGVPRSRILIDPGIGFGKRKIDNLTLLASLEQFVATGYPVLLGASRKRFMGAICGEARPTELVAATAATTALGVLAGVRMFRVHDVKENRQAADVAAAIRACRGSVSP
jgi:dihydropteroate synthase